MTEKCVTGFFFVASLFLFVVNVEASPNDQCYDAVAQPQQVERFTNE